MKRVRYMIGAVGAAPALGLMIPGRECCGHGSAHPEESQ
jgi:hypothetical protein